VSLGPDATGLAGMRWWRLSASEETFCALSTLPIQPYICLFSSHIPSVQSKYNIILSSCSSEPAGYPAVDCHFHSSCSETRDSHVPASATSSV
jgi:hypothetical protein